MSLPYFPMYPTDFEADTSHLTLAEDGAYNRLLRLMWMTPGCSLPDDDAWILRRMRCADDAERQLVLNIIDEFFERKNGRVSNARLTREFTKSDEAHKKRVSAGSKGGKAKSLKTNKTGPSNAQEKPKQPEPEPEPIREEDKSSSTQEAEDYESYLSAHPKPVESKAGETAFSNLVAGGVDPRQIIASARAYAETVKGWSAQAKVQQSDNFLDADRGKWRDHIPKPKSVPAGEDDILKFWADAINKGRYVTASSITPTRARAMVQAGYVTEHQLTERGIAS